MSAETLPYLLVLVLLGPLHILRTMIASLEARVARMEDNEKEVFRTFQAMDEAGLIELNPGDERPQLTLVVSEDV